jgi:hypothetical protein
MAGIIAHSIMGIEVAIKKNLNLFFIIAASKHSKIR